VLGDERKLGQTLVFLISSIGCVSPTKETFWTSQCSKIEWQKLYNLEKRVDLKALDNENLDFDKET